MDISDIWPFAILAAALAAVIFFARRFIKPRGLRLSIVSIYTILTALVVLIDLAIIEACTKRAPLILSPDHRHVALLSFAFQGALDDDYAVVAIRSRRSPFARNAFNGLGFWDFKNGKPEYPEVRWLDNSHLSIRYYDDRTGKEGRGAPATCFSQVGDIQVVCEHLRAPTSIR